MLCLEYGSDRSFFAYFEFVSPKMQMLNSTNIMRTVGMKNSKGIYTVIKRLLDILFSSILLTFLLVPMAIIWIAVCLNSSGGGIFRQIRVGRGGREFVCYKFRTMYKSAPPSCPSSRFTEAEKYITPIGRFLRRASLDELPQLFNVLKGDMSLVGPRPLILAEKEVHIKRQENGVYTLRPGMTGLSQVNGRDAVTDEKKVELDTMYLLSLGFWQDAKILGITVGRVLTGNGINRA